MGCLKALVNAGIEKLFYCYPPVDDSIILKNDSGFKIKLICISEVNIFAEY
jgi:hypothetical protein